MLIMQETDEVQFENYSRIEHVITGYWLHALRGWLFSLYNSITAQDSIIVFTVLVLWFLLKCNTLSHALLKVNIESSSVLDIFCIISDAHKFTKATSSDQS